MKFATRLMSHYPSHLRNVAALPCEIKNSNFMQIFSIYGRECKQIAFLSTLTLLFIDKFHIFDVYNTEFFPILIANTIFHVTVLLLV